MQLSEIPTIYNSASARKLALWVGLWAALCAGIANIQSVSNDNIPNVLIPISLLRGGTLELSAFRPLMARYDTTVCYWAVETSNGVFSRYPIWPGVITAPIFAPVAGFGPAELSEDTLLRVGRFAAVACTGFFATFMVLALRRFLTTGWTIALTFFTVMGSTVLHQIGSNLSNQTMPILCIAGLMVLLTGDTMTRRRALWVGLTAGLALASRLPAAAIALASLGVFLSRREWRRFIPTVASGFFVFPILTLIYQDAAFGGPFSTGYGDEPGTGFSAPISEGLVGMLISPSCGLLVYSPWLIFGVLSAVRCVSGRGRNSRTNELGRWITLGVAGQLLLFSKWWAWNGALTFGGARMMAEAIPALVVLIALGGILPDPNSKAARPARPAVWSPYPTPRPRFRLTPAGWCLTILGVLSVIHFAIGTTAFDVVAPTNPAKPDWSIGEDIIARFVTSRGWLALADASLRTLGLLLLTFLTGGYMVARMLRPTPDPRPTSPAVHRT